jgi:hypothetical protein
MVDILLDTNIFLLRALALDLERCSLRLKPQILTFKLVGVLGILWSILCSSSSISPSVSLTQLNKPQQHTTLEHFDLFIAAIKPTIRADIIPAIEIKKVALNIDSFITYQFLYFLIGELVPLNLFSPVL